MFNKKNDPLSTSFAAILPSFYSISFFWIININPASTPPSNGDNDLISVNLLVFALNPVSYAGYQLPSIPNANAIAGFSTPFATNPSR